MLGFIFAPVFWVVNTVVFVLSSILTLFISPLFIPWRITVWFWELWLDIYDEFKVGFSIPSAPSQNILTRIQPVIIYVSSNLGAWLLTIALLI